MQSRHEGERPGMSWLEMDVLDLQFGEGEFDLLVDKGQLDVYCDSIWLISIHTVGTME